MAFPVLRKNSAKTKESKQAFVGLPRNVCLAAIAYERLAAKGEGNCGTATLATLIKRAAFVESCKGAAASAFTNLYSAQTL